MKHSNFGFSIALMLVLSAACSKEQKQDAIPGYDGAIMSMDSVVLAPTGGKLTFAFSSSSQWEAILDASASGWLKVSKTSGKSGTFSIDFTAGVNRDGENHRTEMVFRAIDGSFSKKLPVSQPCPYLRVRYVDSKDQEAHQNLHRTYLWSDVMKTSSTCDKIKIESNVDWKIDLGNTTDFSLSKSSGNGDATVDLFPAKENLSKAAYESTLDIKSYMDETLKEEIGNGVNSYNFTLSQNNLRFLINDSCDDITVTIDELNKTVTGGKLKIDSELPWSVKSLTEWVNVSSQQGPKDTTTIWIKAEGVNPGTTQRSKDIVLLSQGGAQRTVHVTQSPFKFEVQGSTSAAFANMDSKEVKATLETSGPWSIKNLPDWLKATPLSGTSNSTITFTCPEQNMELSDLKQTVRIYSDLNGLEIPFSFTQSKFNLDLTPASSLDNLSPLDVQKHDITITCSGDWSISVDDPSKVSLSKSSGSGNQTITANFNNANPDLKNNRTAVITLVSETHKAKGKSATKPLTIRQTKFIFNVSASGSVPAYSTSPYGVTVNCSSNWELTEYPDWLKPQSTGGSGNQTLKFDVVTNTDKVATRSGKVKIHSIYTDTYEEVNLNQDVFAFDVDVTSVNDLAPVSAKAASINVTKTLGTTSDVECSDWLTVSKKNSNTVKETVTVTPKDNPSTSYRYGEVKITNSVSGESKTVSFSQKGYEFNSDASVSYDFDALETAAKSFNLTCSGSWTSVVENGSWLHVTSKGNGGTSMVSFNPDKNTDATPRTATVTIYSDLQRGTSDEQKVSFMVTQAAYLFEIDKTSASFAVDGGTETVNVTAIGSWAASSDKDWLTVEPKTGTGNGAVTLTATKNEGDERTATVTFTHDGKPVTVSVAQSK